MRTPLLGCALLTVAMTVQATGSRVPDGQSNELSSAQEASYTYATVAFRERRYAAAYGRFVQLADAGHAPSAQIALVMYRNGTTLFGSMWDATPEQLQHWSDLVIEDERAHKD